MKRHIYSRLALTGMRKNKRLYLPYLCTSAGMVMMFFILAALADSEVIHTMPTGATTTGIILRLGMIVVGLFALIFLFYTNSLLIRRRNKEFGLYNVLGMNKTKLCRILFWETLFSFLAALIPGLAAGVLFSKLAELLLARSAFASVSYSFALTPSAFTFTIPVFFVIFLLLMLFSFARVRLSKPMDLMKSETVGEKPPRANWPLALVGLLLLGGAYYLAVTITDPMKAVTLFFVAVLMVIVGTYLLFIAASVALCRLLQKKKGYYYKAKHFVSVSSMAYRMKRNGAGLASVCILATMVLVMLSSTGCLFIGAEDALRRLHPYDFSTTIYYGGGNKPDPADMDRVEQEALRVAAGREKDLVRYRLFELRGGVDGEGRIGEDSGPWRTFYLMPIEDYNGIFKTDLSLKPGEALLYDPKGDYPADAFCLGDLLAFRFVGRLERSPIDRPNEDMEGLSWSFLALTEQDWTLLINAVWKDEVTGLSMNFGTPRAELAFNVTESGADEEIAHGVWEELGRISSEKENVFFGTYTISHSRAEYYALYGTFFFLGVLLSIVFIVAAALIIYYKQLSEGFEDQSRFAIMQKVGMTKKEIRSTVNSQVLTVFFAPLVLACVHLAFAFPMISKMLILFGIINTPLLLITNLVCVLLFALFYVLIYRLTARAYYAIVSA
jgi:putative ABC transport system permease protein